MVCGSLAEGLELHFLKSQIRIQPFEGRIKEEERNHQRAEFEVSEEAALLVSSNARDAEPVHIKIGGTVAHRMVLPEDGVTTQHDLERKTVGRIELHDAVEVLDRSIVAKSWTNTSAAHVIEHILRERDDPNDVITGFRWTDESLKEAMLNEVRETLNTGQQRIPTVETSYAATDTDPDNLVASFDFQDASALDAFLEVLSEFELDAWVETDGVLVVGLDMNWGEVIAVIESADTPSLASYTVTQSESPISHVLVAGTFSANVQRSTWPFDINNKGLKAYASAHIPNTNGRTVSFTGAKSVESLANLENIATRILINETMNATAGTIEFDGLVSEQQEKLARATRGDHISVEQDILDECENSPNHVVGGEYVTESIHHRLNPREGWRVICEVAEVPQDIETSSYLYDPTTGERYDEAAPYQSEASDVVTGSSLLSE